MTKVDFTDAKFYGTDLQENDPPRLAGQLQKVHDLMIDFKKRTTYEIGEQLKMPAASAHRHLSTLRTQYGFVIEKELIGEGLWHYWIAGGGMATRSRTTRKTKTEGCPELYGKMMQAIHAYARQADIINKAVMSSACDRWAENLAHSIYIKEKAV